MHPITTFVGLDSDGCIVDTMASKQHQFLQPLFIKSFGLEPLAEVYHQCADFVNLYSTTRGITRFRAIYLNLHYFNRHPQTLAAGFPPVPTDDLKVFLDSELPPSGDALEQWLTGHPSEMLTTLLQWHHDVNNAILASEATFPAYQGAIEALRKMKGKSETGIVSQSPERVLKQDWDAHGLLAYVDHVAGQEVGNKVTQLSTLTDGHFEKSRVLMIGDAMGDLQAARDFGCRFYPIIPGQEETSWNAFNTTYYDTFLTGHYTEEVEATLIADFSAALPEEPAWLRNP